LGGGRGGGYPLPLTSTLYTCIMNIRVFVQYNFSYQSATHLNISPKSKKNKSKTFFSHFYEDIFHKLYPRHILKNYKDKTLQDRWNDLKELEKPWKDWKDYEIILGTYKTSIGRTIKLCGWGPIKNFFNNR
jgi:hypothetical protein